MGHHSHQMNTVLSEESAAGDTGFWLRELLAILGDGSLEGVRLEVSSAELRGHWGSGHGGISRDGVIQG